MYAALIDEQNRDAFLHLTPPFFAGALRDPDVTALGAADDGTAAGILVCRMRGGWADVVWLYVDPRFRRRGAGGALLSRLLPAIIENRSLSGVFADYPDVPENSALTRLFHRSAFRTELEWKALYSISLAEAAQNPFWRRRAEDANALSLESLNDRQWNAFQAELRDNEQAVATALPIDRKAWHPRLSVACVSEGAIRGVLLMREYEDALELSCVHVLPESGAALGPMLHKTGLLAIEMFPPDTKVHFTPVTPAGERIAEKIFPNLKKTPFQRSYLWTAGMVDAVADAKKAQTESAAVTAPQERM